MKIGLLECDHVIEKLRHIAGDYSDMYAELLPQVELQLYDVCNGHFPESVDECDGYVCSGSKHSVYENIDWIHSLKEFVSLLYKKQKPFVGVCFGHQILAEALGGRVEKNKAGWSVGVHQFDMLAKESWMTPFNQETQLVMMCQDHVIELPINSFVLAKTVYCPYAMYGIGKTMLGIQGHPEYPIEYEIAFIRDRVDRIGKERVEEAIESLKNKPDKELISEWMMNFFNNNKT